MGSNVKWWFVVVTPAVLLLHLTVPGSKGSRNSESVQIERFEDTTQWITILVMSIFGTI